MAIFRRKSSAVRESDADKTLAAVVHRNIKALSENRAREERRKSVTDHLGDTVTKLAGNLWWVAAHGIFFSIWFLTNLGYVPWIHPFDRYPFALLATITYVEAIFLSSFILISQNRATKLADRRADLDLQIGLLTEHELTHAIHLLDAIARKMSVERPDEDTLRDIEREVSPEKLVEEIAKAEEQREAAGDA